VLLQLPSWLYELRTMRSFFHSASTISIWLLCVFSESFDTACHNALADQLRVPLLSNAADCISLVVRRCEVTCGYALNQSLSHRPRKLHADSPSSVPPGSLDIDSPLRFPIGLLDLCRQRIYAGPP
jgi:hypothetical protein